MQGNMTPFSYVEQWDYKTEYTILQATIKMWIFPKILFIILVTCCC